MTTAQLEIPATLKRPGKKRGFKTRARGIPPGDARRKQKIAGRCNAQRADGTFCWRFPMTGAEHCKKHGGARDNKGPNHPQWKGGGKQWLRRQMPKRLQAAFDAIADNPDITSLRQVMGLVGSRLVELQARLETYESKGSWLELQEILQSAVTHDKALALEDQKGIFQTMLELTEEAIRDYRLWDEIINTSEQYRKLADTERRREEMLQGNLTPTQALALFHALFALIAREIKDAKTRQRMANGLTELLQRGEETAEIIQEVPA